MFGTEFVENNKNNFIFTYYGNKFKLQDKILLENNIDKDIFEIKLKLISNITNMSSIFYECSSLLSLEGISNWNINNVTLLI